MKEIYVYHHLGLGDHITCHGIIRHFCETYEKVFLFVKDQNYSNVRYMYNDIENLNLIVGDDDYVNTYIRQNNINNILYLGFTLNTQENLEFQFYKMANLPIEYKRDKFFINRNLKREKDIFDELKIEKNNYIFLHKGNFEIKPEYLNKNLRIIEPNLYGFFDWMYVIENAAEIHCMDSSFVCLVDNMNLNEEIKLFNHRYMRNYPDWIKVYSGKKWIELK